MKDDDQTPDGKPKAPKSAVVDPPPRRIRHIQPLGLRVLVRVAPDDTRTTGGLYLPQGVAQAHEDALYGEVVEVARAHGDDDESLGENVSGVPAGAMVLFPKDAGHRVPWDHDLRLIDTKSILATVEDVGFDQAH